MNILVLGGCGYVGTVLVEKLLIKNFKVKVIDTQWFGNYLEKNINLTVIQKDIRDLNNKDFADVNIVIHLANIANDPAVELKQELSWEVNVLSSLRICNLVQSNNIKKFIYASSGSVYGYKEELKVTEDLSLVPISTYNKTKMVAEELFRRFENKFPIYIVRPATVCGYSKRMRLDLTVNMLTMQALKNKIITVFGGKQIRPNIHVNDLVSVYLHMILNDVKPGTYNAGFENLSILEIANLISAKIKSKIEISESNDPRSYRLDSSKLIKTGFEPNFNVNYAIDELIEIYQRGNLKDDDSFYTVKWMKKNKI